MKTLTIILSFASLLFFTNTSNSQVQESKQTFKLASFGVRGNCGMCKKTIESSVTNLTGVRSADWDKERKQIVVSYDPTKVTLDEIHQAIANVGYDTEKVKANKTAYNNLAGCCQYDRKQKMNQKKKKKTQEEHSHSEHNHNGHHH